MAHALAIAGAHSNGLTVACADRVGIERGQPFVGLPDRGRAGLDGGGAGQPRPGRDPGRGGVDRAPRQRRFNHVLRDRRRDVYDEMLGAGPSPAADRTVT